MKKSLFDAIGAECPGAVRAQEALSPHTSIKIGGLAECWYEPENEEALGRAVQIARQCQQPVRVVGKGSNVLVPDEGLSGLVVHLGSPSFQAINLTPEGHVSAGAGLSLSLFLKFLLEHGLGECEFLMGIPAQVGGAVAMNAGSGSQWIGSYFIRGRAVDENGNLRTFNQDEAHFGYRSCALRGQIITMAEFTFPKVDPEKTKRNLAEYTEHRRKTQDLKFPSAGCMFANPAQNEKSAGQLIEEAGLKGTSIGGARISEIHANFVVNYNKAKQQDVLAILELAEKTVFEKSGIHLHREIQILE